MKHSSAKVKTRPRPKRQVERLVSQQLPPDRWCDRLPLLINNKRERCTFVDPQGNRCRKIADIEDTYHGDNELYSDYENEAQWVRIAFCAEHFEKHDHVEYKKLMSAIAG